MFNKRMSIYVYTAERIETTAVQQSLLIVQCEPIYMNRITITTFDYK